jgi:hypothetical protein
MKPLFISIFLLASIVLSFKEERQEIAKNDTQLAQATRKYRNPVLCTNAT